LVNYSQRKGPLRDLVDQLGMSFGQGVASQLVESRLELR
jgi:protease-4